MKKSAWRKVMGALGLKSSDCVIFDDGLLWKDGLWLDESHLREPAKIERIRDLYKQRPGFFPDRGEFPKTDTELSRLKREGQLVVEKWDVPLAPREEIPTVEWFRLLNHIHTTGWIDAPRRSIKLVNRFFVPFIAFCPAYGEWRPVHFGSAAAILADQDVTDQRKESQEESARLSLIVGLGTHMRQGKVGIMSYEDDGKDGLTKKVEMTEASLLMIRHVDTEMLKYV